MDTIDKIFDDLHYELITEKQAKQRVLDLFAVSCRLFTIKYYSSYAVFDKREVTIQAKDENEALDKFWNGKNKESWEVTSVSLNGNVSAMSSGGGFGTTHYQIITNDNRKHKR